MITKLHLENFKAFKELEMNFTNLNVFAGINGIGKSSVIQALLLQRQSMIMVKDFVEGLKTTGEILNLGQGKDIFHSSSRDEFIKIGFNFTDGTYCNFHYEYVAESNFQPLFKIELINEENVIKQSAFNGHFQYLSAERIGPRMYFPMDPFKVEHVRNIGYQGEYAVHYLAKFQRDKINIKELIKSKISTPNLLSEVEAWLSSISPGVRLNASLMPAMNSAKLTFQFETGKDVSDEYNPLNVGFGYTYVLPVLIAVLAANKDDLIIIENPESHLHPQGQAVLGEFLALAAKSGIQIIIETHSDHLINGIRVAVKKKTIKKDEVRLFFFDREDGGNHTEVEYPIIDADGRMSNIPKGFLDEYGKQLDQLIM